MTFSVVGGDFVVMLPISSVHSNTRWHLRLQTSTAHGELCRVTSSTLDQHLVRHLIVQLPDGGKRRQDALLEALQQMLSH